jgi:7,8-dihydro-6-hydroxymethylpterin-pyrophosphokinase
MKERMFVLGPLVEVMPAAVIPGAGTVAEAHAALVRTMGTA